MRNLGDGSASLPPGRLVASQPPVSRPAWSPGAATVAIGASGDPQPASAAGELLLCHFHHLPCAIAAHELREALPAPPAAVALPFSPPWLLGVFPWRTELAALLDPAPILLSAPSAPGVPALESAPFVAVLIAGEDERLLGLAVTRLGDRATLRAAAITQTPPAGAALAASPFVRGWYAPDGPADTTYAVLDLPVFASACLLLLEHEAAHG